MANYLDNADVATEGGCLSSGLFFQRYHLPGSMFILSKLRRSLRLAPHGIVES
jgi:hypothetical protein